MYALAIRQHELDTIMTNRLVAATNRRPPMQADGS
jgi:hypothetical protein